MKTVEELQAQLDKIKELMQQNLLTQAEVDDPEPWGEDSNMYSFDYGRPYGAHDVAEAALRIMGVKIELEEGERHWEDNEEDEE